MPRPGRFVSCAVITAVLLSSCAQAAVQSNQEAGKLPDAPESTTGTATTEPDVLESQTPISSVLPAAPPAVPAPTDASKNEKSSDGLAFGGQLFLAIQNWSKVGMSGDAKIGVGLGGSLAIGFRLQGMTLMVGPSLWSNSWSADYSQKSQSATDRVFVTLNDAGISLTSYFDDMFIELGTGNSTIRSGMTVSGKEIAYPYDGSHYSYKSVGIGFKSGIVLYAIGLKNYDGLAKAANHINFMLGLGF